MTTMHTFNIGQRVRTAMGGELTITGVTADGQYVGQSGLTWSPADLRPIADETELTFRVDVSRTYRNKDGYEASGLRLNNSFVTETHTVESFIETVVKQGWPYTMVHAKRSPQETGAAVRGVLTPKHTENFTSSQLLTFDDDSKTPGVIDFWMNEPFFGRYGLAFVESVNSEPGQAEKGHPTLLLDRPITDPALYRECLKAYCYAFPRLDQLTNIDRTIYNAQDARVHMVGAVCPFEEFERTYLEPYRAAEREKSAAIEAERERRRQEAERVKTEGRTVSSSHEEAYLAGYLRWLFDQVAAKRAGDNRNMATYWAGRCIAGVEAAEWARPHLHLLADVETHIINAAAANGYLADHAHGDDSEVVRVFDLGWRAGGEPLDPPTPKPLVSVNGRGRPPAPIPLPSVGGDSIVSSPGNNWPINDNGYSGPAAGYQAAGGSAAGVNCVAAAAAGQPAAVTGQPAAAAGADAKERPAAGGGGNPRNGPHSSDYIAALTALGYTFRLNELDDTLEVNGKPISDAIRAKIFSQMGDGGFKGMARVEHVYTGHAYDNRYHPIKDYLNGLKWDGSNHVERFLDHLTFAENEQAARVFIRRWMLGAVGKVLNQDQNYMLVLDGPQGVGKSHLARWLCPLSDYFIEGAIQPDDKDSLLRLMGHWIWEVGELQSTTRKADREALKNFITMKQPTVRRSFGRYDLKKPACASLIGTVNESGSGFLDDRTGNRRFAVVNLRSIDWNYTQAVDMNQLWAEIMTAYQSGERGTLSPAEKQEQSKINAGYGSLSSVEEYLWHYYEVDTSSTVWLSALGIMATLEQNGLTGNQRANMMELAQILKAKESEGVTKGRPNAGGDRITSYKGLKAVPQGQN